MTWIIDEFRGKGVQVERGLSHSGGDSKTNDLEFNLGLYMWLAWPLGLVACGLPLPLPVII